MRNLLTIAIVAMLSVTVILACGGMSPAPAPADTNVTVPDLPEVTSVTVECPGDIGTPIEEVTTDVQDLSADLPQDTTSITTADGEFVATVL